MRTALTLDPDVERILQQEMRRTNRSMKAVVNDALRLGLGARGKPPRSPRYRVEPHAFGLKPGVDRDRLNQLVDEMEADETAGRYDRRSFTRGTVTRTFCSPSLNRWALPAI